MTYTVEMDSGAMTYIKSFTNIGSGIPNLLEGIKTHRQQGDLISLPPFFSK
jgi:hypothetical protein